MDSHGHSRDGLEMIHILWTRDPFHSPSILANYTTQWLQGARDVYGLEIDYIGIWNERRFNANYIKLLRKYLDDSNFKNTQIVAADDNRFICDGMKEDQSLADTISVVGLHYPYDGSYDHNCTSLGKPAWASEESSSYDDLNGAGENSYGYLLMQLRVYM